jgi:hypothetical protein
VTLEGRFLLPSGYELTYYNLIPRLADCDFATVASQLGLSVLPDGKIPIIFLRREYLIGHDGVVDINGGGESDCDFNRKSILIYYLTSGGRGEPFYQFKLLHHFSDGVFSGDRGNTNWMSDPLRKVFSEAVDPATPLRSAQDDVQGVEIAGQARNDACGVERFAATTLACGAARFAATTLACGAARFATTMLTCGAERFVATMKELGAEQQESKAGATSVWSYQLLPKMPIEIYFYEEDDEFPCETKIMYDGTALNFVPFETLAVLNGCLISEIKRIAEIVLMHGS